jgi:uncharacterized protein (DUF58 family)
MNAGATGRVRVRLNRNAAGLSALLLAMWYASASQNNGAAYLFAFVLAGVAAVSALHAMANLRGLRLSCGVIEPVFAGERQRVPLMAHAAQGRGHLAIRVGLRGDDGDCVLAEVAGPRPAQADLWIEPRQRGRFDALELTVRSLYPLGFFTAGFSVRLPQERWVYPKADGTRPIPKRPSATQRGGAKQELEGDDFAGLRAYVPGEPQRHIDWKAVARGQELVIKQWAGEADESLHLEWGDTAGLAHEARLSQLALWILRAEWAGRSYALAIPGATIETGRGAGHFHRCLRALAASPREGGAA